MGLLSTQVSDFPDLTLWTKSLTGHSARTWAHRVTPGFDEPGPFCRRAPRPAAAYPPRLPQDAHLDAALSDYDNEFSTLQIQSGRLDGKRPDEGGAEGRD